MTIGGRRERQANTDVRSGRQQRVPSIQIDTFQDTTLIVVEVATKPLVPPPLADIAPNDESRHVSNSSNSCANRKCF